MIFVREIEVSPWCAVFGTLFSFILVAEDSGDNDSGKVSTHEGTMTAGCAKAHRPEEGTNDLADREGDHASINDRIEREDDRPFSVPYFVYISKRIERVNIDSWTPVVVWNISIVVSGFVAEFYCLRPHFCIKSKEGRRHGNKHRGAGADAAPRGKEGLVSLFRSHLTNFGLRSSRRTDSPSCHFIYF